MNRRTALSRPILTIIGLLTVASLGLPACGKSAPTVPEPWGAVAPSDGLLRDMGEETNHYKGLGGAEKRTLIYDVEEMPKPKLLDAFIAKAEGAGYQRLARCGDGSATLVKEGTSLMVKLLHPSPSYPKIHAQLAYTDKTSRVQLAETCEWNAAVADTFCKSRDKGLCWAAGAEDAAAR